MEQTTLLWILSVLLVMVGLAGIVLPALPGTILVFLGLLLAAGIDHFERVGWITIVFLGLLTVLSFVLDYVASAYGVKRAGAGKQAVVGSIAGLFVGMFLGIPGIILGPFIGAVIGELMANQDILKAGRAGVGTWLGLVLGYKNSTCLYHGRHVHYCLPYGKVNTRVRRAFLRVGPDPLR